MEASEVLFSLVRQYEEGFNQARLLLEGKEVSEEFMRKLRGDAGASSASCGPRHNEQHHGERPDAVQMVSQFLSRGSEKEWLGGCWEDGLDRVAPSKKKRADRFRGLGNAIVPQVALRIMESIRETDATMR